MKTLSIAIALAVPTVAAADTLPKQVQIMECLVGDWKGAGAVAMGKDKAKVDIAVSCKRTSARFGVLCTMHATGIPGMAAYEETDLFGYEPNTDTYHWYAITSAGETHDHAMRNPGETPRLQWTYNGTLEGKPFKEVVDLDFSAEKTLAFRSESFVAGASTSVFEGKVRK
jgi:hypothetical protein